MALDEKQLFNLAHLSRLELSREDIPQLKKDLGRMLDMAEQISRQNLDEFGPVAHVQPGSQRLREDSPVAAPQGLANAAAKHKRGMIVVPKVFD